MMRKWGGCKKVGKTSAFSGATMVLLRIRPKGCETMQTQTPWWQDAKFPFIRIPKELFQNPYYADLSTESKTLYGFLLDRASLSWEQGEAWRTSQGEVFVIYTLREIQERFGCSKPKAIALLKRLEEKNLIRRKRPQKDGPYHIVVKSFYQGVTKAYLPRSENLTCPGKKTEPAQVKKFDLNNTENNNTEINNTHSIRAEVESEIKKNIEYDLLISEKDKLNWDGILEVMVDVCMKTDDPLQKEKLMAVDSMRMDYVCHRLKQSKENIGSYRAFVLARLTEPEAAVDAFYDAWVRRDMGNAKC